MRAPRPEPAVRWHRADLGPCRHGRPPRRRAARVALCQRHRRLRLGDDRRHADAALSRAARRRTEATAGTHGDGRQRPRGRRVRRCRMAAVRRALGERHRRSPRLPAHRALPSRRHHARVDLRMRRRARRKVRLDGARRQYHTRPLASAARARATDAAGEDPRQLSRLSRDDAGRRLAHGCRPRGGRPACHRVRRRAAAAVAGPRRRRRRRAHVVPRLRPAARARARPRPRR